MPSCTHVHTRLIERRTPPFLGAELMCLFATNPGNSALCRFPGYFVFHLIIYVEDYLQRRMGCTASKIISNDK